MSDLRRRRFARRTQAGLRDSTARRAPGAACRHRAPRRRVSATHGKETDWTRAGRQFPAQRYPTTLNPRVFGIRSKSAGLLMDAFACKPRQVSFGRCRADIGDHCALGDKQESEGQQRSIANWCDGPDRGAARLSWIVRASGIGEVGFFVVRVPVEPNNWWFS